MRSTPSAVRPLPTGLALVALAVAAVVTLYLADLRAAGIAWVVAAMVAGFSLSGSI
jgi:hypothetical protein